jgi:import inner membrane translocase subunit TIM22
MNPNSPVYPGQVPIWPAGKEPLPPGYTESDREAILQTKRWEKYMSMGMESCAVKTVLAGGAGAFDGWTLSSPERKTITELG